MRLPIDTNKRIDSAMQLLTAAEISVSTFENVRTLICGLHPELDKKLETCSKALAALQKLQQGDLISLSVEHLPEENEEQKKRKKALLFFISTVKDLKAEMQRINQEFKSQNSTTNQMMSWGRIIKFAKGPFGLVTLAAVGIILVTQFIPHTTNSTKTNNKRSIQVISYQGKQLPLTGLYVGHGTDCDSPHYHATNGKVTATDGSIVVDPEGCGFGKVAEVQVKTIKE